jgi:hypothetical protein
MPFDQAYAREVLAYIKANPENHKQWCWAKQLSCGTVGCFAYHVCRMKGYDADIERVYFGWNDNLVLNYLTTGESIGDKAADILGIDSSQACHLFDSNNTVGDLENYIENPALMDDEDDEDEDDYL